MILDAPVNIIVGGRRVGKTEMAAQWAHDRGLPVVVFCPNRMSFRKILKPRFEFRQVHKIVDGSEDNSWRGLGEYSVVMDEAEYFGKRERKLALKAMRGATYTMINGTPRPGRRLLRRLVYFARRHGFPVVRLPSAWGVCWKELKDIREQLPAPLYRNEYQSEDI